MSRWKTCWSSATKSFAAWAYSRTVLKIDFVGHAAGVPPDAIGSLPQQSALRETVFSARWKRAISWAGRAIAVALPSAALAYPHHAGFPAGAGLTLLVVVCWWVPLRMAFSTALRALGATAPAAVGTAIGLILVSAFALWVPPLRLGPLTLLNVAALTFLAWDPSDPPSDAKPSQFAYDTLTLKVLLPA